MFTLGANDWFEALDPVSQGLHIRLQESSLVMLYIMTEKLTEQRAEGLREADLERHPAKHADFVTG